MTKKNKLLLPILATSLLVGGGLAVYWLVIAPQQLAQLPLGANIIPQDALLTVSVSTEPSKWQQLREFGTPQTQAILDNYLVELRDRFLTDNGYNYQQDIQPWVGKEVTLAVVSPQKSPESQAMVIVLPIAKPDVAARLLSKAQVKTKDITYKGIQIRSTTNYWATVLDNRFLVISDNLKATERAIDTFKGENSLLKMPSFREKFGEIAQENPFAQVYVNVPAAARLANSNPQKLSPQLAGLQQSLGLATTINLELEGVELKSVSWLKPDSDRVHVVQNNAGKMQNLLPAETLMMVSGGNLQQLWVDYLRSVKTNPLTPIPPENLRAGVKSTTGLDLDEDLLSWMDGEFSLAVIPAPTKAEAAPNDFALSLAFMVQAKDTDKAKKAFQEIDKVISSQYQFKIQETQVAGKPVVNWIAPYGTLTATHGWLEGNVAFFTLGAPLAEKIIPRPAVNLASTEQFQKAVPSELSPNNGQFFLNINPTFKNLPLPQIIPNQQIVLEAVRSVGITTAVKDRHSIRYDIFMALNKAGNPQPLPSPSLSPSPRP
ncbi:DUF3352 domain-containing protein [Synechocystis sp. PCC 7509]|uniref:DUF3352 domain-containing protein n=1 Tax=Synechocystis sp. PCC 7509 TaxID=927677 RepID=UPI0002AC39AF|nr:DUF3352 domain-containing protein [Synechocystis sp. PCC 7509]